MDRALSYREDREVVTLHYQPQLSHFIPLKQHSTSKNSKPFSALTIWVSKSFKNLHSRAKLSRGFGSKRYQFDGMVINNTIYCASPCFSDEKMESLCQMREKIGELRSGSVDKRSTVETFGNANEEESRESSLASDFLASELTVSEGHSSSEESSSPGSMVWPIKNNAVPHCENTKLSGEIEKPPKDSRKLDKQGSSMPEIEMMKERFSKLLLGEDMSGCGNGVTTALAISNAITNLCATLFGQIWRLEPLPPEKKLMWRREMEWLLCVSDHIVELTPSWQTFPDGSKLEIMTSRPRSDLYVNLPALRKLDNMLLEILETFETTEFWYVDQGIVAPEADGSSSFRKPLPRQEEKWWLPVPRVPTCGLSENARKELQHKRDCTNQMLKAAMAINSNSLAEMDVPDSYLEALPKNAKSSLGDVIHKYITSDMFSPECLLDCLDLSSEHHALEIANRIETSMYIWRRRIHSKSMNSTNRSSSKSSWGMVKDLVIDVDRRELLADRAESLLLCLKQRFPGLPQTTLDMSKIQYNKDVGKSILESYSRVLESLAFNIVARIDDLLYVDDLTKHSDHFLSIPKVSMVAHKSTAIPFPLAASGTPYKTAFTTPQFSPSHRVSPVKVEKLQLLEGTKVSQRGFGVKKVLTDYLSIDSKGKESKEVKRSESFSSTTREISGSESVGSPSSSREAVSPSVHELQGEE